MSDIVMFFTIVALFIVACFTYLSGLRMVRDDQVGILTRKLGGRPLPHGHIIARDQEVGIQAEILRPGLYWRLPFVWRIERVHVTIVEPDQVGVVESIDGLALTNGRLLGDAADCDSYQDGRAFLMNGGCKGPQVEILRPGVYRINTELFRVKMRSATTVKAGRLGVAVALDGKPLPPGYIVVPKPPESSNDAPTGAASAGGDVARPHRFFQDGQAFIDSGGYRGPQLDTLQPGDYYKNPLLFEIQKHSVADVPHGYVAVLRSNVGKEPESPPVPEGPGVLLVLGLVALAVAACGEGTVPGTNSSDLVASDAVVATPELALPTTLEEYCTLASVIHREWERVDEEARQEVAALLQELEEATAAGTVRVNSAEEKQYAGRMVPFELARFENARTALQRWRWLVPPDDAAVSHAAWTEFYEATELRDDAVLIATKVSAMNPSPPQWQMASVRGDATRAVASGPWGV